VGKLTQADFLAKAVAVHGSRYGYSQAEYAGCKGKIKITCLVHGEFEQVASEHLRGSGCFECAFGLKATSTQVSFSDAGQKKKTNQKRIAAEFALEYRKICPCCKASLPAANFNVRKASSSGLSTYCKSCQSKKNAAQRKANPSQNKVYRLQKKADLAAYYIAYRANNYELIRARNLRRRAREKAAGQPITINVIREQWHQQNGLCAYCKIQLGSKPGQKWAYHIDHIQPLSKGGTNDPINLQCLCPKCNIWKSDKAPEEVAAKLSEFLG
jgi:5-methylcytosine-specific restriction endonuclease McrA